MRRLNLLLSTPVFYVVSLVAYALARWSASVGHAPAHFPDSLGYEHVHFIGINERFWAVPLVYSVIHSDAHRVIAQVVIGICAWAYLAQRISVITRFRRISISAVLVVGLSPQVIHFDSAILSESLGISFAVGAVASSLHLSQSPTRLVKILWLALVTLTAFTRPTHLILIAAGAIYCGGAYLLSGRKRRKASALILTALSLWGFMQLSGNDSVSNLNFYTVLQRRICIEDSAYNWFIAHNMPDVSGLCSAHGYGRATQLDSDIRSIVQLPLEQMPPMSMVAGGVVLAEWVRDHGWSTYAQYIATHPTKAIQVIQSKTAKTLSPADETFLPTHSSSPIPHQLFDPWWAWSLIAIAGLAISWLSRANVRLVRAVTATSVVALLVFASTILTSAIEYERHGITTAVILRVLALTAVALATGLKGATKPSEADVARAK
ncbi:MAG: hypothetical protein WCG15_04875 [Actinomycetes bacterium]